jgi:hypothetical protein
MMGYSNFMSDVDRQYSTEYSPVYNSSAVWNQQDLFASRPATQLHVGSQDLGLFAPRASELMET